nr:MAG TPA: hypothetical protein [Caudoviricetes sp.]
MASEKTKNIGLSVFPDISGIYQRELRQSYYDNFLKIDESFGTFKTDLQKYIDQKIGEIENGAY